MDIQFRVRITKVVVTSGLRPLYDSFRINFPRRVDQSDCVVAQAYHCRYWARMSPV